MTIKLTSRPALKRAYNASLLENGLLLIGVTPEYSVTIDIQEPWVHQLLMLLDGGKTVLDILSALKAQGHNVSKERVFAELTSFTNAGILEDANNYVEALSKGTLSSEESIRYDRQLLLFQAISNNYDDAFSYQEKLKNSKVGLHGLGGIGSYAFYGLAAMGVGHVKAADFDRVELTNLSRQILYEEGDIGRYKIDVAEEKSKKINSLVHYEFHNKMIATLEDVVDFMKDVDIVFVAADVPRDKMRKIYNEASYITGVPHLFAVSTHTWLTCGPLIIPSETPCYECCMPELVKVDDPLVSFIRSRYTSALIDPYNAMAASMGVLEVIKHLTQFQQSRVKGATILINTDTYETHLVPGKKKPNCRFCA